MTSDITIEKVMNSNFNDFIYLVERLAEYERLQPPDEDARERLRRHGLSENPRYEAYMARVDGQYVAYVIYFFNYSSFLAMPTLYLEDIFVLEEHRRKGIGSRLFKFCAEQALDAGCGRIEFCVLTWNTPAQGFYEKNMAEKLNWYFYRLDRDRLEEVRRRTGDTVPREDIE